MVNIKIYKQIIKNNAKNKQLYKLDRFVCYEGLDTEIYISSD